MLGGLGLVLGGAMLNGIFNGIESSISNAGNYAFQASEAKKNRDFQSKMQDNVFNFQRDMWERTNEYNSAKQQANRFREAGFNPYLMMSQGSSPGVAVAQSGSGASGGSSPSGGFPVDGLGRSKLNLDVMRSLFEKDVADSTVRKNNAEARNQEADAYIREVQGLHEETRLRLLLEGLGRDNDLKRIEQEYKPQLMDASVRNANRQFDIMVEDERAKNIANTIASKELQNYDAVFKLRVAQLVADIRDKRASEGLKLEQAEKVYFEGLHEIEKTTGTKLSNKKARAIFGFEVKEASNRAYWSEFPSNMYQLGSGAYRGMFNFENLRYDDNKSKKFSEKNWRLQLRRK